jgi:hypothetical protein
LGEQGPEVDAIQRERLPHHQLPAAPPAAGDARCCCHPPISRTEITGWLGAALKVKVHAPPVEGRANAALCEFLAETLGLPRRAVTVLRGDTSRQKLVRIDGLSLANVRPRLAL